MFPAAKQNVGSHDFKQNGETEKKWHCGWITHHVAVNEHRIEKFVSRL
jgi:hypothetical protein